MEPTPTPIVPRAGRKVPLAGAEPRVTFAGDPGFHATLRRRVDEYFRSRGLRPRDNWQMYVKSAALAASFATSYVLLVFVADRWWEAVPLALVLALATAGIGFNIQHDGGHQAYSRHAWVNRLMAMSLDVIGGSSYLWHWKHGILHHTYVNLAGKDGDIDLGVLGRLSPHQRRLSFHRWQHIYLWPLYGLMAIAWHFYNDFKNVATGQMHRHPIPRPRGRELAIFVGGKVVFVALAFGIPLARHPIWVVLAFYAAVAMVLGMVLSVVFQLAHCVEEAEFPAPDPDTGQVARAWAIHQVETTVDFARRNRVLAWMLGGLNFQIEHHLFPRVCHVHYPALSRIVESTCREFGVRYAEHRTLLAGLASHYRWLRRAGMATT